MLAILTAGCGGVQNVLEPQVTATGNTQNESFVSDYPEADPGNSTTTKTPAPSQESDTNTNNQVTDTDTPTEEIATKPLDRKIETYKLGWIKPGIRLHVDKDEGGWVITYRLQGSLTDEVHKRFASVGLVKDSRESTGMSEPFVVFDTITSLTYARFYLDNSDEMERGPGMD
jgi:hypothetical protein